MIDLAVLWMLASFLCCHSTTETLNLSGRSFDEGGLMCGMKIPPQDFALKMQGGLMQGGAYLRDTTVLDSRN